MRLIVNNIDNIYQRAGLLMLLLSFFISDGPSIFRYSRECGADDTPVLSQPITGNHIESAADNLISSGECAHYAVEAILDFSP